MSDLMQLEHIFHQIESDSNNTRRYRLLLWIIANSTVDSKTVRALFHHQTPTHYGAYYGNICLKRRKLLLTLTSNNIALLDMYDVDTDMVQNNEKSPSDPAIAPLFNEDNKRSTSSSETFEVLDLARSGSLDRLVDTAKDYARQATAENTNSAYKADWAHFSSWCRRRGADPLPPSPELLGLYIANCASPDDGSPALLVSTIERRLSGLAWHYQQRGFSLDRKDRHIATVLAEDILDMIATLSFGLRDQRDRAILLGGYAGGLRRSEIVCLDVNRDDTDEGKGWIKITKQGLILTFRSKTGWREVEIGRGSSD